MSSIIDNDPLINLTTAMGVWLTALFVPGPNFFLTAHTAMMRSMVEGFATACGIGLGTTVWTLAALLGVGLLVDSPYIVGGLQLCGGIYFIYLGVRMILSPRRDGDTPEGTGRSGVYRAFCRGIVSEMMSVHRMPFLATLLALTLPTYQLSAGLGGAFLLATVLLAVLWYGFVAALAAAGPLSGAKRVQPTLCRIAGVVLIAMGAGFSHVIV